MRADIVIVGGGAGGLELACKLGRALGPAKVTLVDSRLFHIWKPSLHEVAAGTLDLHQVSPPSEEGGSLLSLVPEKKMVADAGSAPATARLSVGCSTVELIGQGEWVAGAGVAPA